MDYAMLLSTLEEYVHMVMNTDENHWWLILGVIVLILLMVFLALGKANSNRLPEHSIENCEYCLISYFMHYDVMLQSRLPILETRQQNFGQWRNSVNHIEDIEDKGLENFDEWRKPVFQIGNNDEKIEYFFEKNRIEIDEDDWDVSCKIVDRVLKIVVCEMREAANKRFPGLALLGTLKKQGSSREGLKVCDPLEFDVLLPFHLEDVQTKNDIVCDSSGRIMPGLFKMEIINYDDMPSWWRKCELLFLDHNQKKTYLNTSYFQKKVFASLLDQTREEINKRFKKFKGNADDVTYALVRSVISPSLKITIQVRSQNGLRDFQNVILHSGDTFSRPKRFGSLNQVNLEIDLVPGMLLSNDEYPKDMSNQKGFFYCERYGVMKWVNKHNPTIEDGNLIWRNSTCGYEKYMFDMAQRNSTLCDDGLQIDKGGITKTCIRFKQSTRKCIKVLPSEKSLSLLLLVSDDTWQA